MQQGGNLLAVGYTQSHQGKDANLSSQVVRSRNLHLTFWQQELVQLSNETRIQLHECLIEPVVEHL